MKLPPYFFPVIFKVILLCFMSLPAFSEPRYSFNVIALGVNGGIDEGSLSAYLLAPNNSEDFILFDAGTLINGLRKTATRNSLKKLGISKNSSLGLANNMLNKHIRAYLISHAHLDHIAGLVIASPDDSKKTILGTDASINDLKNFIFNWRIWPNFSNQGIEPRLAKYHYIRLPLYQFVVIPKTTLTVKAFPLSHEKVSSTAFLVRSKEDAYILYLGDTGADIIEHSQDLKKVWQAIAPIIRENKLKGIFIESSYPDSQSDTQLFGHLKPKWLLKELGELAQLVNTNNPNMALKNLKILVTHIKPSLKDKNIRQEIKKELNQENNLGVEFIILQQGELLKL